MHMEGHIVGFDEYMNIVLDDAEEVYVKTNVRKQIGKVKYDIFSQCFHYNQLFFLILGRVLLKGDNITLIQNAAGSSDD